LPDRRAFVGFNKPIKGGYEKMNDKVKKVLNGIVEKFKTGYIPEAVAMASFPIPDTPSCKWSFINRTLMFWPVPVMLAGIASGSKQTGG